MSFVVTLILNVMGKDKKFWKNYQKKRQKNKGGHHHGAHPHSLRVGICSLVLFLLGSLLDHVDVGVTSAVLELYSAVNQSIEGVVLAHANILAGTMLGTALTADDVTGLGKLTTKNLHAEAFAFALAAVLRTADTFFMCHNLEL